MNKTFVEVGYDIGKLVEEKNEAYGNSWEKTERILAILYPHGIPTCAYPHALLMVRVLDKLCRISQNPNDLMFEEPWKDIAGYGILGTTIG